MEEERLGGLGRGVECQREERRSAGAEGSEGRGTLKPCGSTGDGGRMFEVPYPV